MVAPRNRRAAGNGSGQPPSGDRPLFSLSYVSTQCRPFPADELQLLLLKARSFNDAKGITGLLLHREDSFFQILEGDEAAVRELFASICEDPRHERVEVVAEGAITSRDFNDWQMAFIELDGQDLSALPGFSDILKNTRTAKAFLQSLSRSKKLAMLFSVVA